MINWLEICHTYVNDNTINWWFSHNCLHWKELLNHDWYQFVICCLLKCNLVYTANPDRQKIRTAKKASLSIKCLTKTNLNFSCLKGQRHNVLVSVYYFFCQSVVRCSVSVLFCCLARSVALFYLYYLWYFILNRSMQQRKNTIDEQKIRLHIPTLWSLNNQRHLHFRNPLRIAPRYIVGVVGVVLPNEILRLIEVQRWYLFAGLPFFAK